MRQKFDTRWIGYEDEDGFFLRGWVWDSETRPRPVPLSSLLLSKTSSNKSVLIMFDITMRVTFSLKDPFTPNSLHPFGNFTRSHISFCDIDLSSSFMASNHLSELSQLMAFENETGSLSILKSFFDSCI